MIAMVISFLVGVVVGAVASYLVLRNNAATKAKLDTLTDKAESKLGK